MKSLADLWRLAADEFPDRTGVIHDDRPHTYRDLDAMIRAFAASLQHCVGVQPGERVALVMPNCLHSIVCYLGAIRAGAIALPVNVRLKPEEMRFILQDAEAAAVVVHAGVWDAVREALWGVSSVRHVIGVEVEGEASVTPLDGLLRSDVDAQPSPAGPDDVAAIIYTSGTTGRPKGALITHGNVLFNVKAAIRGHGLRPDDRHLLVVPLFHVTGLNTILPTAFHQGASVVVTSALSPRELLALIERHHVTTFFGVPTTMILLAQTPELDRFDVGALRLIAYSGAPMPVRIIERLRRLFPGVKLHNFFGLTETTSCTTVLPDHQALARAESIGRPVPELELRIVDDAGHALPSGEVGELLVKGPSVVKGYHNRPEATAEAIVDGWLHTGDTAYIDEEGYVFLRGRKKELIIVGGENVYPVEVE
ncbi:MAG: long-chain fatty acid--CoA ligase, partial [Armatimonadetes bacterium]|nr:long-chain fatty acid--CoA ligase [Armatimonadota bacterium]